MSLLSIFVQFNASFLNNSLNILQILLTLNFYDLCSSLKPLDVEFMKAIHSKVNIVPVIAKADTLTLRERDRLKRRVRI